MSEGMPKEVASTCLNALRRLEAQVNDHERGALRYLTEWLSALKFEDGESLEQENPRMDQTAEEYLLNFRDNFCWKDFPVRRGSFLNSQFVDESLEHRRQSSWGIADGQHGLLLPAELAKIDTWEEFDIFKVNKLSHGKALETVAMAVFEDFGLVESLGLDKKKLQNFIKNIEENYIQNPYHNHIHAADVVQALGVILVQDDLKSRFTDLELCAMLLAAVVHDVKHPGLTNEFHVNTRSDMAICYNDNSVNENMHASTAFKILQKKENNVLEGMSNTDFRFVRGMMIRLVLSTDMSKHDDLLGRFQRFSQLYNGNIDQWQTDDARSSLRQMILHCSDISNPARPWKLSSTWSNRIMQELFEQGDKEKELGVTLSPLCRRDMVKIPKSQITFLEFFVKPTFQALSQIAPKTSKLALHHVSQNIAEWEAQLTSLEHQLGEDDEGNRSSRGMATPPPVPRNHGLRQAS